MIGPGKWQATALVSPDRTGTSAAERGAARKQRVRKTQPEGGFIGLGRSPSSGIIFLARSFAGSGIGTADSSTCVNGGAIVGH